MSSEHTSYTLIRKTKDLGDQDAWNKFFNFYQEFIHSLLFKIGLPKSEIEDVGQLALIHLTKHIDKYDAERGRFRSWLSTMVKRVGYSTYKKQSNSNKTIDRYRKITEPTSNCSSPDLDTKIQLEWEEFVYNEAMRRIKPIFQHDALLIFELGMEGLSADEIVARTGYTKSSVYTIRARVKKSLTEEIRNTIEEYDIWQKR